VKLKALISRFMPREERFHELVSRDTATLLAAVRVCGASRHPAAAVNTLCLRYTRLRGPSSATRHGGVEWVLPRLSDKQ
jgi:hypothetical protein